MAEVGGHKPRSTAYRENHCGCGYLRLSPGAGEQTPTVAITAPTVFASQLSRFWPVTF